MYKMRYFKYYPLVFSVTLLSGCMNMPTPPVEIIPTYITPVTYENMSCKELYTTKNALKEEESNLIFAQNQRIKDSKVQAFWWGVGKGDGIAAPEIAQTKGKLVAVEKVIKNERCSQRRKKTAITGNSHYRK